ncbi:MAG: flagellar hook-basal body complex protein FliE [bacterium]
MGPISPLDLKTVLSKSPLLPAPKRDESPSFRDLIRESIQKVDQSQKEADQVLQDFVNHRSKDLHEVMISWEKADISLRFLMQIRNKVLEAYQEVMRMPV